MESDWGGLRLSVAGIPNSMKDHLLFFEPRNQKRSLKETICAMLTSPLTFDQLKPGPLFHTCCVGLVEGLFLEDGILKFVMHKFELQGSQTLSQLITNYGRDMQELAKHVFVSEPIVVNELQISLLPLCQIHGPKMHGLGVDYNTSCGKDGGFLQCSLQPN